MEISRMSAKEFLEGGFLQEANRLFFHPLGLALEVYVDGDKVTYGGVWDYRADPEGLAFDKPVLDCDGARVKAAAVEALRMSKVAERLMVLGFDVQPIPAAPLEKKP